MGATTPLRAWRSKSGVSLCELARISGVAKRTVFRAATGAPCAPDVARKLSHATGLPIDAFLWPEMKDISREIDAIPKDYKRRLRESEFEHKERELKLAAKKRGW